MGVKSPFGTDDLVNEGRVPRSSKRRWPSWRWAWLKAWQLEDAAARGATRVATFPLRFEIPGAPIDHDSNRAAGKLVVDSAAEAFPAKIAPLVDGQGTTSVKLPEKAGDWVELDLNRDWTIGEIQLTTAGAPCWRRFRIMVYETGQKPEEAYEWCREADWSWSSENRSVHGSGNQSTVSYRGVPVQIRFIRLVALEAMVQAASHKLPPFQVKQN